MKPSDSDGSAGGKEEKGLKFDPHLLGMYVALAVHAFVLAVHAYVSKE